MITFRYHVIIDCQHVYENQNNVKRRHRLHPLSTSLFTADSLQLDELLECPIDGRSYFAALVEVDGGDSALADAFGRELEFLAV